MAKPLTPKQQRFVEEYLLDLNATQAAIRAGYSERTAKEMGAENLTKPHVAAAVKAAMDKRSDSTGIDAAFVLKGLRDEATFRGEGASHSARVQAFGLLARHLGLLNDKLKVEHTGKGGGPIQYADATDADLDAEIERLKGV